MVLSELLQASDNDENLRLFWKDLIGELRKLTLSPDTVEPEEIGFRDKKEIDVGANWRNALSSALQVSRVLLCVYSKAYFASEYCGKELAVFNKRVSSYLPKVKQTADAPRLVIPSGVQLAVLSSPMIHGARQTSWSFALVVQHGQCIYCDLNLT